MGRALCLTHHRAFHDAGDEEAWWGRQQIDPIPHAEALWRRSRGPAGQATFGIARPDVIVQAQDLSAGGETDPRGHG